MCLSVCRTLALGPEKYLGKLRHFRKEGRTQEKMDILECGDSEKRVVTEQVLSVRYSGGFEWIMCSLKEFRLDGITSS